MFLQYNFSFVSDLVRMSHNVYHTIGNEFWLNTSFNVVEDCSIEKNVVRSYLFKKDDELVISFKGTSIYWLNSDYEYENCGYDSYYGYDICSLSSSSNDKYNDNLFFSCCFYKQSFNFEKCDVCGKLNNNECCKECYIKSLEYHGNYIRNVIDIVENIKLRYDFDKYNVYFTGHSLGGMLASIASVVYDLPAITFETPGDMHYFSLVNMSGSNKVYHFGHNTDPMFTGNCGSRCSIFGYNIYTKCHTGYTCLYNSKIKLGYKESIINHRTNFIIKNIIPHWENDFPECIKDISCRDCESWEYI